MAVAEGSLRDDGRGHCDVGVLRDLSLCARSGAADHRAVDFPPLRCRVMTDDAQKNWYIVHTYSGFEKKVAESLTERVKAYGLQSDIGEVLIPTEDVV